jgi:cysteinyl-tRNA synthetase
MAISVYNTLTRKKEELRPIKEGKIGMYVCGPTVYDVPHIGHARSAYVFDVIRRYLEYRGYKVRFVKNVTDVDDKIINKAKEEYLHEDLNSAVKKVSDKYLKAYHQDMKLLGIAPPTDEPKATEYIKKMVKFIEDLIKRGVAYQAGGDVYFDIKKARGYGKLSGQNLEKMEIGARIAPGEQKKDPLDFALWKAAKEGEPSWESPWGKGRPGWHIECSVMSSDLLGGEFDIHAGGIDLIFPHHENEIAQSEGAGKKFASYWLHNGLLTINGEKMAKSQGNFITIKDVLKNHTTDGLKMFFLSAHYSNPIDFNEHKIEEAHKAIQRIEILLQKIVDLKMPHKKQVLLKVEFIEHNKEKFFEAMDDDFNTPRALGAIFDLIADTNKFMEFNKKDRAYCEKIDLAGSTIGELARKIFGLSLIDFSMGFTREEELLLYERENARAKKDFKHADEIRNRLKQLGIIVEDTKNGQVARRI